MRRGWSCRRGQEAAAVFLFGKRGDNIKSMLTSRERAVFNLLIQKISSFNKKVPQPYQVKFSKMDFSLYNFYSVIIINNKISVIDRKLNLK